MIETRNFYTVGQVAEFMDVEVDLDHDILVNNREADFDTLVYENFSIEWTVLSFGVADEPYKASQMHLPKGVENLSGETITEEDATTYEAVEEYEEDAYAYENASETTVADTNTPAQEPVIPAGNEITVFVNGEPVPLSGKTDYIFVDIFDRITFDLQAGRGRAIATILNGRDAQFTERLSHGDKIELYWKEN